MAAFGELVSYYQKRIFSVVYGIVGKRQDAEDVLQETFIKAHQGMGSLKTIETFYHWLVRIAVNTSINYKKGTAARKTLSIDNIADQVSTNQTPEEAVERQELFRKMETLLEQLPPDQRAVLVLKEVEGFSYEEIAQALEVPLGTVKSRIYNAREKLRQGLKREE